MAVSLKTELDRIGCDVDPDEFRDTIADVAHALAPAWTPDELLCHPHEAQQLCNAVRNRLKCNSIPDSLTCHTLLNTRKKGRKAG